MPGFLIFGAGAGLMNVPLTNAILHAIPPDRSGIASGLLNASREVAGLLGITVIGAVLRGRQGAALRHGTAPVPAFIERLHAGLYVTIGLALAGVLVSYLALRRFTAPPADGQPRGRRDRPGGGRRRPGGGMQPLLRQAPSAEGGQVQGGGFGQAGQHGHRRPALRGSGPGRCRGRAARRARRTSPG